MAKIPRLQISSYAAQQRAREAKAGGGQPAQSQAGGISAGFEADLKDIKHLVEIAGGGEQSRDLARQIGVLVQKYGVTGLNDLIDGFE